MNDVTPIRGFSIACTYDVRRYVADDLRVGGFGLTRKRRDGFENHSCLHYCFSKKVDHMKFSQVLYTIV